jgi:hypothetical protein
MDDCLLKSGVNKLHCSMTRTVDMMLWLPATLLAWASICTFVQFLNVSLRPTKRLLINFSKIKRIVFEATHKFNGFVEILLSDYQIKQIAGRAGRYGLHGDDDPGGFTTTLHQNDIPVLRKAMAAPTKPLSQAYINATIDASKCIIDCLSPGSPSIVLIETYNFVSRLRWPYQFRVVQGREISPWRRKRC